MAGLLFIGVVENLFPAGLSPPFAELYWPDEMVDCLPSAARRVSLIGYGIGQHAGLIQRGNDACGK